MILVPCFIVGCFVGLGGHYSQDLTVLQPESGCESRVSMMMVLDPRVQWDDGSMGGRKDCPFPES